MCFDRKWYRLTPWITRVQMIPVKDLDVTILSELILSPILNITDLRKSDRVISSEESVD